MEMISKSPLDFNPGVYFFIPFQTALTACFRPGGRPVGSSQSIFPALLPKATLRHKFQRIKKTSQLLLPVCRAEGLAAQRVAVDCKANA